MKKIISIFVAMMMIVSMFTVSAFADFTIGGTTGLADLPGGTQNGNVKITVDGNLQNKYAVDVTFGAMSFTYSTGLTWDPTTHTYTDAGGGSWTPSGNTISITNHSDLPINYAVATSGAVTTYGTFTVNFTDDSGEMGHDSPATSISATEIAKCEVGGEPTTTTITVTVEGTPNQSNVSGETIATVQVTISKVG